MTATLQAGSTGFPRAILQLGSRPGKLKEGAKEPHEGWVLSADSRQASAPSRPALPAPPPTKTPPAEETEGVGKSWSARPGSNRRPSAWEADALPTELLARRRHSSKFRPANRSRTKRALPWRRWKALASASGLKLEIDKGFSGAAHPKGQGPNRTERRPFEHAPPTTRQARPPPRGPLPDSPFDEL